LGGSYRDSAFLNDNLACGGNLSNLAGTKFTVLDVCGTSSSNTCGLSWGVDRNKDDISPFDLSIDISGKEKILPPASLNDFKQTRLVNRKVITVPSINLLLGDISDANTDLARKRRQSKECEVCGEG
jgi:hypothetical protein